MNNAPIPFATLLVLSFLVLSFLAFPSIGMAGNQPLLKNAGFEHEPSVSDGGWTLFDRSMYSNDHARSGDRAIFNWGFSRAVAHPPYFEGSASGSFQAFPADPGSRWRLTGFGMSPGQLNGTPAFGILQISFFDAEGNDLGTVETRSNERTPAKVSNEVNNQSPAGEWILLDTEIATAPVGTTTVQAFTLFVDYSGSKASQGVYFDDLTLCVLEAGQSQCPAPSTQSD